MKVDCSACHPKTNINLCSVHRRAYTMQDTLRELQDAYLERGTGIISGRQLPDEGRLAKAMIKVGALLTMIQVEDNK